LAPRGARFGARDGLSAFSLSLAAGFFFVGFAFGFSSNSESSSTESSSSTKSNSSPNKSSSSSYGIVRIAPGKGADRGMAREAVVPGTTGHAGKVNRPVSPDVGRGVN
jgi:hypothetical protein